MTDDRRHARRIFDAGVAAADPFAAVASHLAGYQDPPALVIAVGKAARRMAQAALVVFPGVRALVVTNYENAVPLEGATVLAAGHPVPDENGLKAALAVQAALATAGGPVLALISGGGSALLPAPAGDITLAEKAAVNRALLSAGMNIAQMNLIRQQLSRLKGGGFARLAAPYPVTALILSDVVGDDLSVIASGPTVAPLGNRSSARKLLKEFDLWNDMPAAVQAFLLVDVAPEPLPPVRNLLIGSNAQSVAAMAMAAGKAQVMSRPVEGDVTDAARLICDAAADGITLWGGETTVKLQGTGRGGRNQELALRIALQAKRRGWADWVCLAGGSDGRDGPTDAAGGIVDAGTLNRIAMAGADLDALLSNNDSYEALRLAGDLLVTGATGTNVADLGVLIRRG